jgi:hypothetical protein
MRGVTYPTLTRQRHLPRRPAALARSPWPPADGLLAALVALLFLALVVALMGHVMRRLDPVTGDEPFYLVTAGSILHDRDIDETNNWADRDVDAWLPPDPLPPGWEGWPAPARGYPPHASQTIRPGLYSKHGLGVPVLILVPLALGGRAGVVLFYGLIGALVAANMFLLARTLRASVPVALAITAALALTNPILSYSFLIFPELPAALCTLYAFRRLLLENNRWQSLAIGLAIALLPWLHARLALIALALTVMALVRYGQGRTRYVLPLALGPPVLSAGGLAAFYWYFYGRPWPNTQDHAGLTTTLDGWAMGLAGLLLDQQWGLLIHAPVYLLVAAGAVALLRSHRDVLGWLALVALPYYAFIGAYNQWWGEWCPPARYLATLAPLAAAPLAALWRRDRTLITATLVTLLSLPGAAVSVAFLRDPQLMYNHPTGQSNLLIALSERGQINWTLAAPSFVVPDASPDSLRLWWLLGLLALVLMTTMATFETAAPPGDLELRPPRR